MVTEIVVHAHPLLRATTLLTEWPRSVGELHLAPGLTSLLAAPAPVRSSESLRAQIRAMLRASGFKPSGRSKPASEYLLQAVAKGELSAINAPVDLCNAVSFHSGLPISVVDLDLATPPFHIAPAQPEQNYIFNTSGQVMDLAGLLCLWDALGPCANAIKDSQRTKTHSETRRTLSVIWGHQDVAEHLEQTATWYELLLQQSGGSVQRITMNHL